MHISKEDQQFIISAKQVVSKLQKFFYKDTIKSMAIVLPHAEYTCISTHFVLSSSTLVTSSSATLTDDDILFLVFLPIIQPP